MVFVAETARQQGYTHVLLITTGSVASIKAPLIVAKLLSVSKIIFIFILFWILNNVLRPDQYANVSVQVVATTPSLTFYNKEDMEKTGATVWTDADEWTVGFEPRYTIARH